MSDLIQSITKQQLAALYSETNIDLKTTTGVTFIEASGIFQGTETALEQMFATHPNSEIDLYFDGTVLKAAAVKDKNTQHLKNVIRFDANGSKAYAIEEHPLAALSNELDADVRLLQQNCTKQTTAEDCSKAISHVHKAQQQTDVIIASSALENGFGHLTNADFNRFFAAADAYATE